LFDTDGNCVWQAEHDLWGETEVSFAKKADNYQPLVDCNLRFQNQWEDKETGLYYNLNRYYDPDSGQYLSTDLIGLEGGLRTHGYVHDPMQWVDPMGLAPVCPKKLPPLKGTIKDAFEGPVRTRTFKAGDRVYRSPNTTGGVLEPADSPGPWFTTRATKTKIGAESQTNIKVWGNPLEEMRVYEFKKDTTVYYGKVAGGKGYQILIPRGENPGDVVQIMNRWPLK
jgi:RHS repeat-associated protein